VKVHLLPGNELTAEHVTAWSEIQRENVDLHNPFLSPQFTRAVAAVRDDVEVAVIAEHDRFVGFLPFQRSRLNIGRPVGGRLCNLQGLVIPSEADVDGKRLICKCGLAALDFHQLIASQPTFEPFHQQTAQYQYVDLSNGFEAYIAGRRGTGSKRFEKIANRARKAERELGPIRLEPHTSDRLILRKLVDWKSQQFQRTGLTDVFGFDWTRALLETLLDQRSKSCCAMLSVLYAGDTVLAISYGLRYESVMDGWFMAYDPEYSVYAPGLNLITEMARMMPQNGIARYLLGSGPESYKQDFCSWAFPVASGSVDVQFLTKLVRGTWRKTRDLVKSSPLRGAAELPARLVRPFRRKWELS
jgi:CelD/BcsL family acetyltransferase involved in cellulose biosynthesis